MPLSELATAGKELAELGVHINYDIIRLFSEGLYRSPHKAVEELVSNGYDAGAERVRVLLPAPLDGEDHDLQPLWVIDDGHGMDEDGFEALWLIAESSKSNETLHDQRPPIGQFGIGKLAAYVLAWNLTHLSHVDGKYRVTSMDFHRVTGRQAHGRKPVPISLREVDEHTAKSHVADIEHRDPEAWSMMFGSEKRAATWTAAGLSDFKDLYTKLSSGRLRWVLSAGLPLHTNFKMWLNGVQIASSKENIKHIKEIQVDEPLADIGRVTGTARIYSKPLTGGKAQGTGRSHGFFIRVRGRVINLDDELFGMEALNHAAWSRFALEVNADGLRNHLLSSREGVRDSDAIQALRKRLREIFNACRSEFEAWDRRENGDIDIHQLMLESPSAYVTDPLRRTVRDTLAAGSESFYVDPPSAAEVEDEATWLQEFDEAVEETPFDDPSFEDRGPCSPALRYLAGSRTLLLNSAHPFIDKLTTGGKRRGPAKLFASSEVLIEGQLADHGMGRASVESFLVERDRVLRLAAGDAPPTASEVLRRLHIAQRDPTALERAIGLVFQVLGFEYQRKGGNAPGPDGLLFARLGRRRGQGQPADYALVYDAKQTNEPAVPADKVNLSSLEDFRTQANANYGFFVATQYQGQNDPKSKLNRQLSHANWSRLSLLTVSHLRKLVWLHYRHGITLSEIQGIFRDARTTFQTDTFIAQLEVELGHDNDVPLEILLDGLERAKDNPKIQPNIFAVQAKNPVLEDFEPERLIARLKAVETIIGRRWIEVAEESGNVVMHQGSGETLSQLERNLYELRTDEMEDVGEQND